MSYYFERYLDQARAALADGSMERVSDGELIRGIEDIGGHERSDIAQAVPAEAAIVARALMVAEVPPNVLIEFSPDIPVSGRFSKGLKAGWKLGDLDGAPYMTANGNAHRESDAGVMLNMMGDICAYRNQSVDTTGRLAVDGLALNRYSPVCSTSMNDRTVLYGLATRTVQHDLEIPDSSL